MSPVTTKECITEGLADSHFKSLEILELLSVNLHDDNLKKLNFVLHSVCLITNKLQRIHRKFWINIRSKISIHLELTPFMSKSRCSKTLRS